MTNPAFNLIGLTDVRNQPNYQEIDGQYIDANGNRLRVAVND